MRKTLIRRLFSVIILLFLYDLCALSLIHSNYVLGIVLAVSFLSFSYMSLFFTATRLFIMIFELPEQDLQPGTSNPHDPL
jgi:hypothetical protein